MTILQSLNAFYERLDRRGKDRGYKAIPDYGFKPAEIDYVLEIDANGRILNLISKISPEGNQKRGPKYMVPGVAFNPTPKPEEGKLEWEDLCFVNRTSGRRSYIFWDKGEYVFGVAQKGTGANIEPVVTDKSKLKNHAFQTAHEKILPRAKSVELKALLNFVLHWKPEQWEELGFPVDALGKHIAFRLHGQDALIHENQDVHEIVETLLKPSTEVATCLLTGVNAHFARKQPQFKGVVGAQSSGASIVSFNSEAYESFGKEQGANAPVSERAAFRYGAALNWLLDRDNSRLIRIGEATLVFWADENDVGNPSAEAAECVFWSDWGPPPKKDADKDQAAIIGDELTNAAKGRAAPDTSKIDPATQMHILALSPNAGRIAIRFWLVDSFGHLAENLSQHEADLKIEPPAFKTKPKAWLLLYETANQRKAENIPPRLGGELVQAILSGGRYPRTLLSAVIGRIRADKEINGPRVALCKAVVNRNIRKSNRDEKTEGIAMALNPGSKDSAYNLGRLFAVYEYAETSAANRNATIRDKYIGAASATPRRVFPILMRGYEHNASKLAKGDGNQRGSGVKAAKTISGIIDLFDGDEGFPQSLNLESQARFFIGYYHQNAAMYVKKQDIIEETE